MNHIPDQSSDIAQNAADSEGEGDELDHRAEVEGQDIDVGADHMERKDEVEYRLGDAERDKNRPSKMEASEEQTCGESNLARI